MNALRHPALHLVLRLLLGGLFLYFSLDKMRDPPAFARIVYQWQVLGAVPSNLVAVTLPWLEALAGILLLAGIWRREAALVVAILLVVFIAAAGSVMARGIDVENCGCTSVAAKAEVGGFFHGVGWFLVLRNALLLASSLVLVGVPLDPVEGRGSPAEAAGPSR
ncbi:MAG TPA: MauE/DoxX family redox-associated membrane protein [Vicinamibacteria bacterium]|nr:MauE/DoxX family redox-associated membrane protein [Vicinamibacteria bacterium]